MTTETRRPISPAASAPLEGHWADYRACRDEDPELFFPVGDGLAARAQTEAAKQVCGRCPVRVQCLEDAFAKGDQFGVFGGLSSMERRRLLTVRGRSMPNRPSVAMGRCDVEADRVRQLRSLGASVKYTAAEIGVSRDTLTRWLQIDKALQTAAEQEVAV
ncbi:WhiB family transcriptional regulator [Streptomyces sp. NPDC015130]|uniref:WhiB family transcriptional regulator n=1 Tax=Streptomyces sp. NPDC015130 TaxID=3364940 RepID=UPI0036FEC687